MWCGVGGWDAFMYITLPADIYIIHFLFQLNPTWPADSNPTLYFTLTCHHNINICELCVCVSQIYSDQNQN